MLSSESGPRVDLGIVGSLREQGEDSGAWVRDEGPGRTADVQRDGDRDAIVKTDHRHQETLVPPRGLRTPTGEDSPQSACGLVVPRLQRQRAFLAGFQRTSAFLRECITRTVCGFFGSFKKKRM